MSTNDELEIQKSNLTTLERVYRVYDDITMPITNSTLGVLIKDTPDDVLLTAMEKIWLVTNDSTASILIDPCNSAITDTGIEMEDNMSFFKGIEEAMEEKKIDGNTSDGYHTFNELYHHRAILFAHVCKNNTEKCWKSKLHHDGTMYDNMFIVGIDTPEGQASYHYDIEPYWSLFNVVEMDKAPEWDGHTPDMAIKRLENMLFE